VPTEFAFNPPATANAPTIENLDRVLRIHEVAQWLRVSVKTVRRLIDAGQLSSVKIRGIRLVREAAVKKLLSEAA